MAVTMEKGTSNLVEVVVEGKLTNDDYQTFMPLVEEAIKQHGKVRIVLIMKDFEGWTAGALWEDLKFDWEHANDIEKLAMVGDKKWEKGMSVFCKPFTSAEIKFFEPHELEAARLWAAS